MSPPEIGKPPPVGGGGSQSSSAGSGTHGHHTSRAGDRRDIDRIRERIDCRRLADELGVEIARRSGEWWSARCPTPGHEDTDPSAGIGEDGWRCHGCGASGDAFDLWQIRRGCDFAAAKDALADRAGLDLPDRPPSRTQTGDTAGETGAYPASGDLDGETPESRARALLGDIWAACDRVGAGGEADGYLESRGLSVQCARREGIRWAEPDDWRALRMLYRPEDLRAAGLMKPDGDALMPFWWWEGPFLIFPYRDPDGEVVSLRFRRCFEHDGPKALGLRRAAGDLHRPPLPFGAPVQVDLQASVRVHAERCPLYVTEGELDAIALWQEGRRAVATPSASQWPEGWCAGWEAVRAAVVLPDGDVAGEELVRRVASEARRSLGAEWLERHLSARTLGDGRDPCDALEAGTLREDLEDIESALRPFPEAQASPDVPSHEPSEEDLAERAAVLAVRDGLDRDEAEAEAERRGTAPAVSADDRDIRDIIDERVSEIEAAAPWTDAPADEEE